MSKNEIVQKLFPAVTGNKLLSPMMFQRTVRGRSWRCCELRIKSHEDLHKLWYVLIREQNALKSQIILCNQKQAKDTKAADVKMALNKVTELEGGIDKAEN